MDKTKFNDKKEWRKFGLGVSIIIGIIATIQLIIGKGLYIYFYSVSLGFLMSSFFLPIILKPIFIVFSYLGFCLGWFMTRVILSILYYSVFTVIGGISKLFGKNFIDTAYNKNSESYWIEKKTGSGNLENQY